MKFKDLTQEDKDFAYQIYWNQDISWDERMKILMGRFERSERTIRKWFSDKLNFKKQPETIGTVVSEQYEEAKKREFDKTKTRFIVTWGQNDTPVHKKFFKCMTAYAEFHNADMHVIAGRYRNPTSLSAEHGKVDTWVDDLVPYLDANRNNIHKFVSILSDIKIQPTATNPMSSLNGVTGANTSIFGAPKVQQEMVSVLHGEPPKMMVTTGACTIKNYTETKAGKKGEFHHTLGFVFVEIKDDDHFYLRQVTANADGSFNDLYYNVKDGIVTDIRSIEAIILGDIHLGKHDPRVFDLTFNKLLKRLKPNHVVMHDVFDGNSINHHESKDPFIQYRKEISGENSLRQEINNMVDWFKTLTDYNITIVRSNHDDFVDRWLINSDWKQNIKNSLEYMEFSSAILRGDAPKGIIPYVLDKNFTNVRTLDRSTSFRVKGWELGYHGDVGANGSKGSLQQFRNLNTKCVIGHVHSPGRKDGALAVGTSTHLRVGYNNGPSNWLQSHVIIHNDGKAQHIHFIGENLDYTTFD